jgi:hypothetical protein
LISGITQEEDVLKKELEKSVCGVGRAVIYHRDPWADILFCCSHF